MDCRAHSCAHTHSCAAAAGFPGAPSPPGAAAYAGLRGGAPHLPPRPAPYDACRASEAYMGDTRQAKELAMSPKTRQLYKEFSHTLRSKETQAGVSPTEAARREA